LKAYTRGLLLFAGGALWVVAAVLRGVEQHSPPVWDNLAAYPLSTAAAVMVFFSALGLRFSFAPVVWFGKISYGLYVYHSLAIYLMQKVTGVSGLSVLQFAEFLLGSLTVTTLMAAVSFYLLERPFLKLKARFSRL
jgi:peptidoglycan/LPS O-acetylase OafA/YrhL